MVAPSSPSLSASAKRPACLTELLIQPLQAGSLICYLTVCSILGYKEQGHLRKAAFAEGLLSLKGWPSGPEVPFL